MRSWYSKQTDKMKVFITFLFYIFLFFLFDMGFNLIGVFEPRHTLSAQIVRAIIMSAAFTLWFNWKLVKKVFSKNASNEPTA